MTNPEQTSPDAGRVEQPDRTVAETAPEGSPYNTSPDTEKRLATNPDGSLREDGADD